MCLPLYVLFVCVVCVWCLSVYRVCVCVCVCVFVCASVCVCVSLLSVSVGLLNFVSIFVYFCSKSDMAFQSRFYWSSASLILQCFWYYLQQSNMLFYALGSSVVKFCCLAGELVDPMRVSLGVFPPRGHCPVGSPGWLGRFPASRWPVGPVSRWPGVPLARCPVVPLARCPVVPLSRWPGVPLSRGRWRASSRISHDRWSFCVWCLAKGKFPWWPARSVITTCFGPRLCLE